MSTTPSTAGARSRRRWLALGVIAAAQFMVFMDTSIIGVALLKMQHDLGFTPQGLSWVFNAYVVAFGGLLLLGGRLSDLFGARRIFSLGWVVLAAGSMIAGFAGNVPVELAGHVVVMRADAQTFAHEHAEVEDAQGRPVFATPGVTFGPELDVHAEFDTPGVYQLWGQFRLADGDVVTVPFTVEAS